MRVKWMEMDGTGQTGRRVERVDKDTQQEINPIDDLFKKGKKHIINILK